MPDPGPTPNPIDDETMPDPSPTPDSVPAPAKSAPFVGNDVNVRIFFNVGVSDDSGSHSHSHAEPAETEADENVELTSFDIVLNDSTTLSDGTTWADLKAAAMDFFYKTTTEYKDLSNRDTAIVDALIDAQNQIVDRDGELESTETVSLEFDPSDIPVVYPVFMLSDEIPESKYKAYSSLTLLEQYGVGYLDYTEETWNCSDPDFERWQVGWNELEYNDQVWWRILGWNEASWAKNLNEVFPPQSLTVKISESTEINGTPWNAWRDVIGAMADEFTQNPPYTISPVFEQALLLALIDAQLASGDNSAELVEIEAVIEWIDVENDLTQLAATTVKVVFDDETTVNDVTWEDLKADTLVEGYTESEAYTDLTWREK